MDNIDSKSQNDNNSDSKSPQSSSRAHRSRDTIKKLKVKVINDKEYVNKQEVDKLIDLLLLQDKELEEAEKEIKIEIGKNKILKKELKNVAADLEEQKNESDCLSSELNILKNENQELHDRIIRLEKIITRQRDILARYK